VAELEGADAGHCFASGMAAITAGLDLLAPAGTRVVAPRQLYGQVYAVLRRRGDTTFCDIADLDAIAGALDDSALLYVETVANPQIDVADLPALGRIARDAGAAMFVDNTVATPLGCRPLEHGATLVAHSATKYLNGHSDALAGVLVGNSTRMGEIAAAALDRGATLSPDTAYLVRRGLRTLDLRLERSTANAGAIARMLDQHPRVVKVRYPGLPGDRSYEVAQRVLSSPGGLLSFGVDGGATGAAATMDACRLCLRATSLGGVETTVSHPASTSHRQLSESELAAADLTAGTLRLSVGIEDADDLITDMDAALRA
jgi:cystathionine beta-lyase/cystathionine gamma-synthase